MLTFSVLKKHNLITRTHHGSMIRNGRPQHSRVGHILRKVAVQPKLLISTPDDKYEQEADHMADAIMRLPDSAVTGSTSPAIVGQGLEPNPPNSPPLIQRVCAACATEEDNLRRTPLPEPPASSRISTWNGSSAARFTFPNQEFLLQRQEIKDEEEFLQTKRADKIPLDIQPGIEAGIASLRGGGQPLPLSERAFFEPRFGQDFSQVRVHADAAAAERSRALHARAFTVGHDVVFGAGEYAPETENGRRLLAHELSHVIQQNGPSSPPRTGV